MKIEEILTKFYAGDCFGIDTFGVKTKDEIDVSCYPFITKDYSRKNHNGESWNYYRINPNKYHNINIYNYKDLCFVMDEIISETGLQSAYITRIDHCLDSFLDNYDIFLKPNKFILLLLCGKYEIRNRYQSKDLSSQEQLNLVIKNNCIEGEFYNKALQEPGGVIKSRLELRTKKLIHHIYFFDSVIQSEFKKWEYRLDRASETEYINSALDRINLELIRRFNEEKYDKGFNMNNFLYKYNDCIFIRSQLIKFYDMLGIKNPKQTASNYIARHDSKVLNLKSVKEYIKFIKAKGEMFYS